VAEIKFLLNGKRADVEAALVDLRQLPEVASVSSTEVPQIPPVLSRGMQHQFELYEALVSIALGLASSAAYDGIKVVISTLAEKRNIKVKEMPEKDDDAR